MGEEIAFCTVSFSSNSYGNAYNEQQERLVNSINSVYKSANIFRWTNQYPDNSRSHFDSTYGFKVHAIDYCINLGYKKVIWLDTAMIINDRIDYLFEKSPVSCIMDVTPLKSVTMDRVKSHYDIDCDGWFLCGGSLFSFDFTKQKTIDVFNHWKCAESLGFFGNQNDESFGRQQGHRWDETMMSIALYQNNLSPIGRDCLYYDTGIIEKKHFK